MFSRATISSVLLVCAATASNFLLVASQFVEFNETDIQDRASIEQVDGAGRVHIDLTILFNTFGISELLPRGDEGGIARFTTVVGRSRRNGLEGPGRNAKRRGVIALNAGSTIHQGKQFQAGVNMGQFFDATAMELAGFNAIGLGRRDFDFGPNILADFIGTGFNDPIPFLSSNLDFSGEASLQGLVDSGVIVSSTVLWAEYGVPIGIVSAVDEELGMSNTASGAVAVNPIAESVQAEVDALRAAGARAVVLMSQAGNVGVDIDLAALLTGVNVIISGGRQGTLLANPDDPLLPSDANAAVFGPFPMEAQDANGDTVLVASVLGKHGYLGELYVGLTADFEMVSWSGGPKRVVSTTTGPDGARPNEEVQLKIEDKIALGIVAMGTNIVGTTNVPLEGRQRFVNMGETNLGSVIADAVFSAGQTKAARYSLPVPHIALYNGGGIKINDIIAEGVRRGNPANITEAVTFDTLPFTASLVIVPGVNRKQLREILENGVAALPPMGIGRMLSGRFLQIAGFTMVVDTSFPAQSYDDQGNVLVTGERVREVFLADGTAIVSGGRLKRGFKIDVVTDKFLARGGDDAPFADLPFFTLGVTAQTAFSDFIGANPITARNYPEGGTGRIAIISPP